MEARLTSVQRRALTLALDGNGANVGEHGLASAMYARLAKRGLLRREPVIEHGMVRYTVTQSGRDAVGVEVNNGE